MTRRIHTEADLAYHLDALVAQDPRLAPVAAAVEEVPLRRLPGGLRGLLRIVMGQQLSIHAAAAVWARLEAATGEDMTAAGLGALSDDTLRSVGLSRQKAKTLRAVAASGIAATLGDPPNDETLRALLLDVPGIGPWTADLYLIVCTGAPDIMPAGDLALRKAAEAALALEETPTITALEREAGAWSPHRSAAARLLWAYYRLSRGGQARAPQVDDRAPV